jgi:hypothetical protein
MEDSLVFGWIDRYRGECLSFSRFFSFWNKKGVYNELFQKGFDRIRLVWRRLFQWEEELLGHLEVTIRDVHLTMASDIWS